MARPKKPKKKRGVGADVVRSLTLGPNATAFKRQATSREWARVRDAAHRRGFSVEAFLSSAPDALKPRSETHLRRTAAETVRRAYAPADAELGNQERRINAVNQKRQADNAHFRDWLERRSEQLKTDAETANRTLEGTLAKIQSDSNAAYDHAERSAQANLAATPGAVSNPAQATALDFEPERQRADEQSAAARESAAKATALGDKALATQTANNQAYIAAQEARRTAETWEGLSKVGDERQQLQLKKAADTAGEVARLLDQEIKKAESNREFDAIIQQLGIDREKLKQDQTEFDLTLDQRKREAADKRRHQQGQLELGTRTQEERERHNRQNERRDQAQLRIERRKARNPKDEAFTESQKRDGRKQWRGARNLAQRLLSDYGNDAAAAYEELVDPDGDYKLDPLLARAALLQTKYKRIDRKTRDLLRQEYGI